MNVIQEKEALGQTIRRSSRDFLFVPRMFLNRAMDYCVEQLTPLPKGDAILPRRHHVRRGTKMFPPGPCHAAA